VIEAQVQYSSLEGDTTVYFYSVEGIEECVMAAFLDDSGNLDGTGFMVRSVDETKKEVYATSGLSRKVLFDTKAVVAMPQENIGCPEETTDNSTDNDNDSSEKADDDDSGELLDDDAAVETRLAVAFGIGLSFLFLS